MEKIRIPALENSSITKDLSIEIDRYAILAGENNTGKTSIIKSIYKEYGEERCVYIPAENINPEDNLKISAENDPMRKAISGLLDIKLENDPSIEGGFEKLFKKIEENFNKFGVENTKLSLDSKKFKSDDFKKWLKDNISKKILESSVIDSWYKKTKNFTVSSVGQGIQRLIVFSIIQGIKNNDIDNSLDKIIIFEEPEIYLHPKLKQKLHKALLDITDKSNIKVIVSTHDPYFIQLNSGQNVYHVERDSKGSTIIKGNISKYLPEKWRSFSEINYQVFHTNGEDYLNELYGFLEDELGGWKQVDSKLEKLGQSKTKERTWKGKKEKMTIGSYIRNEIHHRSDNVTFSEKDVDNTIKKLQKIIKINKK